MVRRRAPKWLTRRMLDVLHDAQLREHGGAPGVRDEGLIESALARAQQKWAYADSPDLPTLAAAYAFGLARNHGYIDANKRVAFMAAYILLGMNGKDLDATEPEVVRTVERLAAGRLTEAALADWFRVHIRPSPDA